MDKETLKNKYMSTDMINSLINARIAREVEFKRVIKEMKEKARVDYNTLQEGKNPEEVIQDVNSISLNAEYELLEFIDNLCEAYF
jgi:hypothetical protein|nr:MAG TPA: hypothetical protein [Bacteriophage sp.]